MIMTLSIQKCIDLVVLSINLSNKISVTVAQSLGVEFSSVVSETLWLGRPLTWVNAGILSYLFCVKHCETGSAALSTVVSSRSGFGASILSQGTFS